MTAIANLPDLRPSLLLDFANTGRADPRIQCARASAATCFGPDGKLRTVASNVPRIDYDPVTGKCLGLLVEEARTNLLLQSSTPSGTAWAKTDVLVTPGGTQNALGLEFVKLTPVSGTYKTINQALSAAISDNQIVTFSVFAKAGEMNTIRLGVRDKTNFITTGHFNLLTGEASRQEITGKYLRDGWWRVALSGVSVSSGSTTPHVHIYAINNSNVGTPGDGVSGLYIAAPQLEVGSFPTSYIPTDASAVTRATDQLSMAYAQDGSGGSLLVDAVAHGATVPCFVVRLHKLSNHYIGTGYLTSSTVTRSGFVRASADSAATAAIPSTGGSTAFGNPIRTAIAWGGGVFRAAFCGGISTDTVPASVFPDTTQILFGADASSGAPKAAMAISRVAVYSKQLTALQLQRMTQL